jgi:hypothetical protein
MMLFFLTNTILAALFQLGNKFAKSGEKLMHLNQFDAEAMLAKGNHHLFIGNKEAELRPKSSGYRRHAVYYRSALAMLKAGELHKIADNVYEFVDERRTPEIPALDFFA